MPRTDVLLGKCSNARREYDLWGGWTNRPVLPSGGVEAASLSRSGVLAARRHVSGMRPANLTVNLARLETLAKELRGKGVEVMLVTLPVSRHYSEHLESGDYARMQSALTELQRTCGLMYRNYMYDVRFSDLDYQDADHLNRGGATKFTLILKQDMDALLQHPPSNGLARGTP
jgi:hypothetical protein